MDTTSLSSYNGFQEGSVYIANMKFNEKFTKWWLNYIVWATCKM